MDLIYMPEVLSYGSLRHPQYRDYEQPWNEDYFSHGKSTTKAKNQYRQQPQKPASKRPCLICKENKRRTLAAYIRDKARQNSCNEIHEEIEEIEDEEDVKVKVEVKPEDKTVKICHEEASLCRKESDDAVNNVQKSSINVGNNEN